MWRILAVCVLNYIAQSDGVVSSWRKWRESEFIGLSDDKISRTNTIQPCQPDGAVLLVYQDTTELNSLLADIVPSSKPAWTDGDDGQGNCFFVTVFGGKVYEMKTACDDDKNYLCYRSADSVATTTASLTTVQITTSPPTTEPQTSTIESQTPTHITTVTDMMTSVTYEPTTDNQDLTSTLNAETTRRTGHFPGLAWNAWIPWTECTASCNSGTRFRLKLCAMEEAYTDNCTHSLGIINNVTILYATQWDATCNSVPCPEWSDWTPWADCSATCGTGTTRRYRKCSVDDDFKCLGDGSQTEFCNLNQCPVRVPEKPPEEDSFKESDKRPLAIGLGSLSMIFVFIELVMIIMLDCITITTQCRYLKRNLEHLSPRRE